MDKSKRRWLVVLVVVAVLFTVAITQWRAAIKRNRQIPFAPFRIAGNLYYVGTSDVTAFLLTGPQGHVLIDGGYPESAPMIVQSMAKLGFRITDVKVLLNSHAHFDHAGGLKELQEASGAELWVSEGDADAVASGGVHDPSATFLPFKLLQPWAGNAGYFVSPIVHPVMENISQTELTYRWIDKTKKPA